MADMNFYLGRERQRELLREAEQEREIQLMLRSAKRNNPALAWMGRRLTKVGNQLLVMSGEKN